MFDSIRSGALRVLKVPPEPQPPAGEPASLRVFRAGRNFYRLRIAQWILAQGAALLAIVFWAAILVDVEATVRERKEARAASGQDTTAPAVSAETEQAGADGSGEPRTAAPTADLQPDAAPSGEAGPAKFWQRLAGEAHSAAEEVTRIAEQAPGPVGSRFAAMKQFLVEATLRLPDWTFPIVWIVKVGSFAIYLIQIPITYAVRRLDYEMRWYMVTDRSLRLRHGVWRVTESTMSFANVQQVVVNQGPLQRLLGLADVKVQSAGGGGGGEKDGRTSSGDDMHLGLFRHVTNASEIRDLILDRLRRFRQSGLGDPDERMSDAGAPGVAAAIPRIATDATGAAPADVLAAAQELLAEARALRASLGGDSTKAPPQAGRAQ